jgi:hypothetical protein
MARAQEDLWVMQGYLMALAEMVRRHDLPLTAGNMLADRGLGHPDMAECSLEPHDVRELVKAMHATRALEPEQPRIAGRDRLRVVDGGRP